MKFGYNFIHEATYTTSSTVVDRVLGSHRALRQFTALNGALVCANLSKLAWFSCVDTYRVQELFGCGVFINAHYGEGFGAWNSMHCHFVLLSGASFLRAEQLAGKRGNRVNFFSHSKA